MECEFCKKVLKNNFSLNRHKNTNRQCLKIQNRTDVFGEFQCDICLKVFDIENSLERHRKKCSKKDNDKIIEQQKKIRGLEELNEKYKNLLIKGRDCIDQNEEHYKALLEQTKKIIEDNQELRELIRELYKCNEQAEVECMRLFNILLRNVDNLAGYEMVELTNVPDGTIRFNIVKNGTPKDAEIPFGYGEYHGDDKHNPIHRNLRKVSM